MSEARQIAHYQTHLSRSLLGGWTWSCLCRATGAAPTREDANRAFVSHLAAPSLLAQSEEPCRFRPHAPHGKCPGWTRAQHGRMLIGDLQAIAAAPVVARPAPQTGGRGRPQGTATLTPPPTSSGPAEGDSHE